MTYQQEVRAKNRTEAGLKFKKLFPNYTIINIREPPYYWGSAYKNYETENSKFFIVDYEMRHKNKRR